MRRIGGMKAKETRAKGSPGGEILVAKSLSRVRSIKLLYCRCPTTLVVVCTFVLVNPDRKI